VVRAFQLFPVSVDIGARRISFRFRQIQFLFHRSYGNGQREWRSLLGTNLVDGKTYKIAMSPTGKQNKVIPESFRIILRQYLRKPEVKSMAPNGNACTGTTQGLLRRSRILANQIISIGKETDRRWEQGEDPSMIDSDIFIFEKRRKLVVADPSERKKLKVLGLRRLVRETKLTQAPVSNVLRGKPVRPRTLSIIRQTADRLVTDS
jgi:hypothetical protein